MNILFTTENSDVKQTYFPQEAVAALERLGHIRYNPNTGQPFSEEQLIQAVPDMDICITHWGCPCFSEAVLASANRLRLIAHAAGSVADLVSPDVYSRGIKVCSANTVMAKYVAEGVLAYILAGLKSLPQLAYDMKYRHLWRSRETAKSLYDARVGLVGLGTIGRFLLDLLAPFHVQVKVYDPYVSSASLSQFPFVTLSSLEDVLTWGDIISIHASLTKETYGLLNAGRLKLIRDHALLVNTARGAIVDEQALAEELRTGRINAVLDVYQIEPLPLDSPLRALDTVSLFPHCAGSTDRGIEMTWAMIAEIERFIKSEPLQFEIPFEKYRLMTTMTHAAPPVV
jgi:phosphoglycerate dehydrogenase-like enzyme